MPFGPSIVGVATFATVKLVGYSYAGVQLNKYYTHLKTPAAIGFGVARTILGIAAGVAVSYVLSHWGITHEMLMWYLLLFPVRMAEWGFTIWLFYERRASTIDWGGLSRFSFFGSMWSYLLDIPAALSVFVVPQGVWIC
jgi:hypothetical protein